MPQVRIGEDQIKRREARISKLNEKKGWIKSFGDLKDHPAWVSYTKILDEVIKTQEARIGAHLDSSDGDPGHYAEAQKCQARKVLAKYLLSLVGDPGEVLADLDSEIAGLQDEVRAGRDGELI